MNKYLIAFLTLALFSASPAFAADLSVKLSQPKTPSRLNSFKINFVALDMNDHAVTVRCFKKGPSDGGFSQFGSTFTLDNGGNTNDCIVDSSVMNTQGKYEFKVSATDGIDPIESNTVTVEYKTDGPSTPVNYSKEKINDCTWKIKFTTASDGGKTKRVEVYRSDNSTFNADSGNMFASITIGSGENGEASITVPNCAKTWYFAVRAFDEAGNGSGILGDSENVTITTNSTSTTSVTGAVALKNGSEASVNEDKPGTKEDTKDGAKDGSSEGGENQPEVKGATTTKGSKLFLQILAGLSIIAIIYVFFFKKGKK